MMTTTKKKSAPQPIRLTCSLDDLYDDRAGGCLGCRKILKDVFYDHPVALCPNCQERSVRKLDYLFVKGLLYVVDEETGKKYRWRFGR